jgi:hypothetical protein
MANTDLVTVTVVDPTQLPMASPETGTPSNPITAKRARRATWANLPMTSLGNPIKRATTWQSPKLTHTENLPNRNTIKRKTSLHSSNNLSPSLLRADSIASNRVYPLRTRTTKWTRPITSSVDTARFGKRDGPLKKILTHMAEMEVGTTTCDGQVVTQQNLKWLEKYRHIIRYHQRVDREVNIISKFKWLILGLVMVLSWLVIGIVATW